MGNPLDFYFQFSIFNVLYAALGITSLCAADNMGDSSHKLAVL